VYGSVWLCRILKVQQELQATLCVCREGRRDLNLAKRQFTTASLGILANYRKRQVVQGLLHSLNTIKTLVSLRYWVLLNLCWSCDLCWGVFVLSHVDDVRSASVNGPLRISFRSLYVISLFSPPCPPPLPPPPPYSHPLSLPYPIRVLIK